MPSVGEYGQLRRDRQFPVAGRRPKAAYHPSVWYFFLVETDLHDNDDK
jgi:hypothetical protein